MHGAALNVSAVTIGLLAYWRTRLGSLPARRPPYRSTRVRMSVD